MYMIALIIQYVVNDESFRGGGAEDRVDFRGGEDGKGKGISRRRQSIKGGI